MSEKTDAEVIAEAELVAARLKRTEWKCPAKVIDCIHDLAQRLAAASEREAKMREAMESVLTECLQHPSQVDSVRRAVWAMNDVLLQQETEEMDAALAPAQEKQPATEDPNAVVSPNVRRAVREFNRDTSEAP